MTRRESFAPRAVVTMKVLWIASHEPSAEPSTSYAGEIRISTAADAVETLRAERADAVVMNTPLPEVDAVELIHELRAVQAGVPILVRDAQATLDDAIRFTKAGAFHVIRADAASNELNAALSAAIMPSRAPVRPDSDGWRGGLIGESQPMLELVEFIKLVGPRRCTVLINGETGTGKEVVAKALHLASPRANMPFVALNCAAVPEQLLEAELFGHVRGAYTGAMNSRTGRFEQAHRGTMFLDEIADMPYDLQAKLLRVLQEREIQRLGGTETTKVDVRVIAACNVDLRARVRAGRFREDLYYRLNVVPVRLPPLRERATDIPGLAAHFIRRVADNEGMPIKELRPEVLNHLLSYDWPGNVRELENLVEMAMVLSGERIFLAPEDFRFHRHVPKPPSSGPEPPLIPVPDHGLDFERIVGQIELSLLEQALRKTNGNKKQAADMLGLKRTTLAAKLKSLEGLSLTL